MKDFLKELSNDPKLSDVEGGVRGALRTLDWFNLKVAETRIKCGMSAQMIRLYANMGKLHRMLEEALMLAQAILAQHDEIARRGEGK